MGEVQSLSPIKTQCALSSCFNRFNTASPLPNPLRLFILTEIIFFKWNSYCFKGRTKLMVWALYWSSTLLEILAVACLELIWTRLATGCWGLLPDILQRESCWGFLWAWGFTAFWFYSAICSWTGEVNGYPFCDDVQDDFYSSLLLSVRCLVSVHSQ